MSTKYPEIFAALAAEFTGREVRTRSAGNRQVPYITARTVMNRLDSVLGPENWTDAYVPLQNGVLCTLTITLPDGSKLAKSDAGGHAGMSDEGDDEKSGFSDAFKRAAVKFGVGRHLYGEGVPRYGADSRGDGETRRNDREPGSDDAPARPRHERPRLLYINAPKTGREFYAWVQSQPKDIFIRAGAVAASWGYPAKFVDLNREEVEALYNELTTKAANGGFGSNGNGNGNVRH